jgi:hypothetical protein
VRHRAISIRTKFLDLETETLLITCDMCGETIGLNSPYEHTRIVNEATGRSVDLCGDCCKEKLRPLLGDASLGCVYDLLGE